MTGHQAVAGLLVSNGLAGRPDRAGTLAHCLRRLHHGGRAGQRDDGGV